MNPEENPKQLWQQQAQDQANPQSYILTSRWIGQKISILEAHAQKQRHSLLASPITVLFFYLFSMKSFPKLFPQLHLPFGLALAWSLTGLLIFFPFKRALPPPVQKFQNSGLDYIQQELQRQSLALQQSLRWAFPPILTAIATFLYSLIKVSTAQRGLWPDGLPFLLLLAAWGIAYGIQRQREQRWLQAELEELRQIED